MALPLAQFRNWVIGQLVKSTDLIATAMKVRELVGMASFAMTGQTAFLPASNAVQVIPGTGMQVKIGGLDQTIFLPDPNTGSVAKAAYSTAQVSQAINAADPSLQRNDLICVQVNTPNVNGDPTGKVLNNGVVTTQTVYDVDETFSINYVAGTPGSGDPPVPAGWTALARVIVPAASSSIASGNIVILLATTSSIFKNLGVASLNALVGAVTLTSPDSSIAIAVVGQQIRLTLGELIVNSLNGITGGITLTSSDGSVTITNNSPSAGEINLQVPTSNIGEVIAAFGSGVNSIVLPGTGSQQYMVTVEWVLQGNAGTYNANISLTSGAATGATTVPIVSAENATCVWCANAVGGQTLHFGLNVTSGNPQSNFTRITAIRTA